jgi:hypothetical protein
MLDLLAYLGMRGQATNFERFLPSTYSAPVKHSPVCSDNTDGSEGRTPLLQQRLFTAAAASIGWSACYTWQRTV